MNIVLLGYMGSGKSSVGKALAQVLGYQFVDLDQAIEAQEQQSISEIFKQKGELFFRKQEAIVLDELLQGKKQIIAVGGGTPCYGNVMENLKENIGVKTIYLKNNLDTLTTRLWKEKDTRPLIAHITTKDNLNDFIRKHLFERSFYYNQADNTLACDGLSIDSVVKKIVLELF